MKSNGRKEDIMSIMKKEDTSMCVRCNEHTDLQTVESTMDLRTITMSCGYNMSEFDIPLKKNPDVAEWNIPAEWNIRVCKPCRRDWLIAQELWFQQPTDYSYYSIIKHFANLKKGRL